MNRRVVPSRVVHRLTDQQRKGLVGAALIAIGIVSVITAANSPLLAWRDPVYILAGFAGIIGFVLLLMQPLLVAGCLPWFSMRQARHVHRWCGILVMTAVMLHVVGLWFTSPPDVVDALLLVSPTPFSVWGVIALWAIFVTACLALVRRRWRVHPRIWRVAHQVLAVIIVLGTVIHALLIDGTMGDMSKMALSGVILYITVVALMHRKPFAV